MYTGKEPNVLLILLDDVGYAHLGAYGGQDTGSPVSKDYDRDNVFSGNLDRVVIKIGENM